MCTQLFAKPWIALQGCAKISSRNPGKSSEKPLRSILSSGEYYWNRNARRKRLLPIMLPNLRSLDLSHNRLDARAGDVVRAVSTLASLAELDLSHNALHGNLTERDFTEYMLDHLDATRNPTATKIARR